MGSTPEFAKCVREIFPTPDALSAQHDPRGDDVIY
jgi:hypothetical protein